MKRSAALRVRIANVTSLGPAEMTQTQDSELSGSCAQSPKQAAFSSRLRKIPAPLMSPLTESPGDTIGPYKLLQQIGEGGMGVVYMAEQKEPVNRRVALKIIKPGMDTQAR